MAETRDLSHFVHHLGGGIARMELAVDGINCGGCMRTIETGLAAMPDITRARVNLTDRRVAVEWRDGKVDPAAFIDRLSELGYRAYPYDARRSAGAEEGEARMLLRCLGVAAFAAMNVMLLSVAVWSGNASDITPEQRDFFHWLSALIALPAAAYAGRPFFQSAIRAIRARRLNMDVPITVGVVLALAMSVVETLNHAMHAYFDSALMLLTFLLVGRVLEQMMRRRTRAVAANLAALRAETATTFVSPTELAEVPVAALTPGDLVLVRPGERIAVDGIVAEGRSEIDQSLVTGETLPAAAHKGSMVYAGTLNRTGALRVTVSAAARGTLLDEVSRMLDRALEARSHYVRLADRAARLYAPLVHAAALTTMIGWLAFGATWHDAIVTAIAVLIITCPCALGLAVPAVQVVASGALFRAGVLLNSGEGLERLAGVDTILFDKTGTLTLPEPEVVNAADIPPDRLALAGRLALASRHPLAAAVARASGAKEPLAAIEEPGQGVRAIHKGVAMRLGRPAFCGAEEDAARVAIGRSGGLGHCVCVWRRALRLCGAPAPARRCGRGHRQAETAGFCGRDHLGRPRERGSTRRDGARRYPMAGRHDAGRQDRPHRGAETAGPQGPDGRRRPQRRPLAGGSRRLALGCDRRASDPSRGRRGVSRRAPRPGYGRARHRAPRPPADAPEPGVRGGLQCRRGADRDLWLCESARRRVGDVGVLASGHAECAAGTAGGSGGVAV